MTRQAHETRGTYSSMVQGKRLNGKLLRELTRRIVDAYHPDEIILFGSRVYGEPRAESDLDVLVVMNTRGNHFERAHRLNKLFSEHSTRFDFHVHSLNEVTHRLEVGDPFYLEIVSKGRVLYEHKNGDKVDRLIREKLKQGKETPMDNREVLWDWVEKAEGNFNSASALARQKKKLNPDDLCWMCEQCAEKYFKAFLIRHRVEFKRDHNLVELHKFCSGVDRDFKLIARWLDAVALCKPQTRYPGASVTEEQARAAFGAMKEIRKFARAKLGLR